MMAPDEIDVTPAPAGAKRFTRGLVVDVGKVLEQHGYAPLTGPQLIELQIHLWFLLHGAEEGCHERCMGGSR